MEDRLLTPHQYVQALLVPHVKKKGAKKVAQEIGVSEGTIRYSLEDGKARPETLLKIVGKLEGLDALAVFMSDYASELGPISIEATLAKARRTARAKHENHERLSCSRKAQEVLIHTGSKHGINYDLLVKRLPNRLNTIEDLIEDGIIHVENGVAYSSTLWPEALQALKVIALKSEIIHQADDRFRLGKTATDDSKVSLRGMAELHNLISDFIGKYNAITEEHSDPEGITTTMGLFLSSLNLEEKQKDEFEVYTINEKDEKDEN